jgi:predicted dehydrogenase
VKIGVVGLGFMGSTHLQAWAQVEGAQVVALCDPKPHRLAGDLSDVQGNLGRETGRQDFSRMRTYRNYEEVAADPDVEAVDICLPTSLHLPAALAALRAGKHVLVEKPMALDVAQCEQMIEAAKKAGKILMVAQVVRFWPDYAAARDILRSGRLGPVKTALFQRKCAAPAWGKWLKDAGKSGGGAFDLLIHDVDYCLELFGKPASVRSKGVEEMGRGIDWVTAELEYPGGPAVVITGGWHHPKSYPFSMELTVVAEGGTLDFHSGLRRLTLYRADGEVETPPLTEVDGFVAELRYFVDCARNGRWPEACKPEDSAEAVRVMLAIRDGR